MTWTHTKMTSYSILFYSLQQRIVNSFQRMQILWRMTSQWQMTQTCLSKTHERTIIWEMSKSTIEMEPPDFQWMKRTPRYLHGKSILETMISQLQVTPAHLVQPFGSAISIDILWFKASFFFQLMKHLFIHYSREWKTVSSGCRHYGRRSKRYIWVCVAVEYV